MGLAVSIGKDNNELIDNLVSSESVKSERLEHIMRLVDRGRFVLESERENAYKDSAWKAETADRNLGNGALHLSAPCIYASVLEHLNLDTGMSFLNIGSGTGYLSSMVGFIIGEKGISHGVELYPNIVEFANDRINEIQQSEEASAFEWCSPTYHVGNAFQIESKMRYDRIYCGALVPESRRAYFCAFLNVGGVLIMPYGHALHRIVRKSENEFITRDISAVTFSHLIPINPENPVTNHPIKLPMIEPPSLRSICRNVIRRCIRQKVEQICKIEMRITLHNKSREETRRIRDDDDSSQSSEQRVEEDNIRLHRRLRRFPLIFFEREDREDADLRLPPHRFHPMRHLFALMTRERLNRHHAARARQEAGLAGGIAIETEEEHQEQNEERHRFGPESARTVSTETQFGFHFISENRMDEDVEPRMHALFDENREEEDDDDNDADDTEAFQETIGELNVDNVQDEELQNSSEADLLGQNRESSIETENDNANDEEFIPLAMSSPKDEHKLDLEAEASVSVDQSEHSPDSTVGEHTGAAANHTSSSGMGKRQRTLTSQSIEQSPHARKIKRTSGEDPLVGSSKCNADGVSANESNCAAEESSFCGQSNNEVEERSVVSAEQQTEQLHAFHAKFTNLLNTLPLNIQMRQFLAYKTD